MPALFSGPNNQCLALRHGNNGMILFHGTTCNQTPCGSHLGPWLPTYKKDFTWHWHACPKSFFYFISLTANGGPSHPSDDIPPILAIHTTPAQHQCLWAWFQQHQYYFHIKSTCHYHCQQSYHRPNQALFCLP